MSERDELFGYRKPGIITTMEELDTLQDGMIILSGNIAYAHHDGEFHGTDGSRVDAELIGLPATVVYEPGQGTK